RAFYRLGGNHPDDIDRAIRLFRWFQNTPLMSGAIATWTEGDRMIDELRLLGEKAHARVLAGDLQAPEVVNLRGEVIRINKLLTPLEARFAAQLSDAARLSEWMLLWFNLTMAVLLG